jgi:alkylhydroperoxidase/carboxymuconolactone decarboxylase family protein YurZ
MLSSLQGADSQLQAHMGISMNVGITAGQLTALSQVLADRVGPEAAARAQGALARQIAARAKG